MGVVFYDTHFCIIYAIVLIRGSFVLPIDSLMNAKNNGAMQISCNTYRVGSPPMPDTGTSNRYTNDISTGSIEATRLHLPLPGRKAKYSMKQGRMDDHNALENSAFNTGTLCYMSYTERAVSLLLAFNGHCGTYSKIGS